MYMYMYIHLACLCHFIHVLFVQIFKVDVDEMIEDLEKGDVAETAKTFFEASEGIVPAKTSTLTLADVS